MSKALLNFLAVKGVRDSPGFGRSPNCTACVAKNWRGGRTGYVEGPKRISLKGGGSSPRWGVFNQEEAAIETRQEIFPRTEHPWRLKEYCLSHPDHILISRVALLALVLFLPPSAWLFITYHYTLTTTSWVWKWLCAGMSRSWSLHTIISWQQLFLSS